MAVYLSMLRGINVSGQKKILMADLKTLCESLAMRQVKTYIQSGNVIFDTDEEDPDLWRQRIETAIRERYGFEVTVIMRTAAALARVLASNPLLKTSGEDTKKLYVTFLAEEPERSRADALDPAPYLPEEFVLSGKEICLSCPHGYGDSKLSNNFFEQKLRVRGTTRNWRTVQELHRLMTAPPYSG